MDKKITGIPVVLKLLFRKKAGALLIVDLENIDIKIAEKHKAK